MRRDKLIEIRNLLFQPLAFHLSGDGGGLHLGSRERRIISKGQLSDEIRTAAARGFVSISDVPESTQPDPRVEPIDVEHAGSRQKKRRVR